MLGVSSPLSLPCNCIGAQGEAAGTLSEQSPSVSPRLLPTSTGQGATASQAAAQLPPTLGQVTTTASALTLRVEAGMFENPSLPPIPPQHLKSIVRGKYIDMGKLLPGALSEEFDRSQQDTKDDNMATSKHKFSITTPLDWAVAFPPTQP